MENEFPINRFLDLSEISNKNIEQSSIDLHLETMKNPLNLEDQHKINYDDRNSDEIKFLSENILNHIKNNVSPQKYTTFFDNLFNLSNITEKSLEFTVTTPFIKTIIEKNYLGLIEEGVQLILGRKYEIIIDIYSNPQAQNSPRSEFIDDFEIKDKKNLTAKTAKDVKFSLDFIPTQSDLIHQIDSKVIEHLSDESYGNLIDPKKTFDSYIVGPSNNMAYASAVAIAKQPGKTYPSVYFHSSSGLGKTHLLHATANMIKDLHPQLKIYFTSARDFMTEMIDYIAEKKIAEFRKKYSEKIDVLIIDDIHELKNKAGTQNEFFHVFNELHNKGKQLIFTSDKHPKEIDGLEERIKTRLSWGLVLDIQAPDIETRIAILKKKALEEDIFLPDDVLTFIASSVKNNIRELEGSLIRLGAYSSVFKVDIDLEIARDQLKLTEDTAKIDGYTIENVSKIVSQYFKVPLVDLRSKVRLKEITDPRHIAMYLAYKICGATLIEIGNYFGKRDHTSVMHAIEKVKQSIKTDPQASQIIVDLEKNF